METNSDHKHTNSLANSSSPYLKQHAHNPVDWVPWSDDAFEKAEKEGKLLFISIGYSACHWCHVMEHQTFEDEDAAEFINEHFVSIKVDREERPDVDAAYMHAVQIMTGRGGWPLNCIALPDGRPIFGGTYFPKDAFIEKLGAIVSINERDPDKINDYATRLQQGVYESDLISAENDGISADCAGGPWPQSHCAAISKSIDDQVEDWKTSWDRQMGLTQGSPKFPLPTNLDFLLHYGSVRNDQDTLSHVRLTLDSMSRGGIYDQIGGGFARYSTDSDWMIPHFEKMLYDNAQLLTTYSHAYQAFKDPSYKRIVFQTINFIFEEFSSPSGGFYSALDADSEGIEGKFYVWTPAELQSVLTPDEYKLASYAYEVDVKSRWEHGTSVLMKWQSDSVLASNLNLSVDEFRSRLDSINEMLKSHRSRRVKPGLDDKVLSSWTALTVSGLCNSFKAFGESAHLERAEQALNFILKECRTEKGGLYHSYHQETGHSIDGFLEDYAFTIKACLDFYEATFNEKWLENALELTQISLDEFYDEEHGTFWFTSKSGKPLFAKKQENDDSVIPASNSTMVENLFKIGKHLSRLDFIEKSDRMLLAAWGDSKSIQRASNWGISLLRRSSNFHEVLISSSCADKNLELKMELSGFFTPQILISGHTPSSKYPQWIKDVQAKNNTSDGVKIYLCKAGACNLPAYSVEEVIKGLNLDS